MGMADNKVKVIIEAEDKASKTLEAIWGNIENIAKKWKYTKTEFAAAWTAIVWTIWAIWIQSIDTFSTFEKTMSWINAVLSPTWDEFQALSDKARQLWRDTAYSAEESAKWMEMLAKNWLTASQILDWAADATLDLASATWADLSTAADIATDAMLSFWLQVDDLNKVVNSITWTTNVSKFGIEDYALALSQWWWVAKAVWVNFEDFNTTIAGISPLFASGSDAWTSFKTFLLRLVPASDAAAWAMMDLWLITKEWKNQFFDATWKMKSMAEISWILQKALKWLSDEQKNETLNTIFGTDALRAASWIAGIWTEKFKELSKAIEWTDASENAKKRMDNLRWATEQLMGSIDDIFITFWDKLAPAVRWVTEALTFLANQVSVIVGRFDKLPEPIKIIAWWFISMTIAATALVWALAVLSVTLSWVWAAFIAISTAMLPWIAWIAIVWTALIALKYAFDTNFMWIRDLTISTRNIIQNITVSIWSWITAFFAKIRNTIQSYISDFLNWFVKNWWDDLNEIWNILKGIVWPLLDLFKQHFDWIKKIFTIFFEWSTPFWKASWEIISSQAWYAWDFISEIIATAWAVISYTIKAAIDVVITVIKTWLDIIKNLIIAWDSIINLDFKTAWDSIINIFKSAWNWIVSISKSLFWPLIDWISQKAFDLLPLISQALDLMKKAFNNMFNDIKNIVSSVVNSIIWFIDNLINKITKAIDTIKNFGKNAASAINNFSFPWAKESANYILQTIWYRAEWWPVSANSPYIVWEEWPELFVPSSSWTIIQNSAWTSNATASNNINISINLWGVTVQNDADENRLVNKIKQVLYDENNFRNLWII